MKRSIHAKRMARHHRRNKQGSKLNLVSLMDIFTILVFFLLVNSSDVEVLQTNKSIKLPESKADKKPENTLMIQVSKTDIVVNGRAVAQVEDVLKSDKEEIFGLKDELIYQAARKPYQNEEEQKKGRDVTIQGDASIPYALLKKIMNTCAKNEFRNISMAVTQILEKAPDPQGTGG